MGERILVDDALDRIRAEVSPGPVRDIPVDANALGNVTAACVYTAIDSPRFDCSAMDGVALRSGEVRSATPTSPVRFPIVAEIAAEARPLPLQRRTAANISTGAAIPSGADAVIAREKVRIEGNSILVAEPVVAGHNIRNKGEDVRSGTRVLEAGVFLEPDTIGALLAWGIETIPARRPPRLTILTSGSELVADAAAAGYKRLDVNGPMIAAMARAMGLEAEHVGAVPDCSEALIRSMDAVFGRGGDILVTTGGVSAGRHDHMRTAILALGGRIVFHGVAMRPGKPLLFAIMPDGRPFFGLPGNPVAALVGFRFFVTAAIRRMLGVGSEPALAVPSPVDGRDGITLFLRGSSTRTPFQLPTAHRDQRSHVMASLLASNCWIRVDGAAGNARAWAYDKIPRMGAVL